DIFCMRAKKYIGAYFAELGGTDAVVFTGGIGENSATIRERIGNGLARIGLTIDKEKNNGMVGGKEGEISTAQSTLKAFVIPTNEELLIARDTVRTVKNVPRRW
ncbi:MAG TPA: acetate kinase, partial [Bacteroidota bacterium]|nr:acetate kinase [Bacteroidota bacterium]